MDNILYNNEWVLNLRSSELTSFFIVAPFFASGLFYISVIALGYWLRPKGQIFVHLAFLVPFSTLLNLILKNSFGIPRPPLELHLVPVHDMLGFPSGDVQVAAVFWGIIYLRSRSNYLKLLTIGVVAFIMMSRVYLGVHNIADVIAGLFFALLTIVMWKNIITQNIVAEWFKGKKWSYWLMVVLTIVLYYMPLEEPRHSPMLVMAIGALIGYGLSLNNIFKWQDRADTLSVRYYAAVILSFIMLIILAKSMPAVKETHRILIVSNILENALLVYMIFSIFPGLQAFIINKETESK